MRILPHERSAYLRLEKMLAKLIVVFENHFDNLGINGRVPEILLIDSSTKNAHVTVNFENLDFHPYLIVVEGGILELSDNQITGILAHELAHLLLQGLEGTKDIPETKYFIEKQGQVSFSQSIVNDPVIAAQVEEYMTLSGFIGPYMSVNFGRVPVEVSSNGLMGKLIQLARNRSSYVGCKFAADSYSKFHEKVIQRYDPNALDFKFKSLKDRKQFYNLSSQVEMGMRACLKGLKLSYRDIFHPQVLLPADPDARIFSPDNHFEMQIELELSSKLEGESAVSVIFSFVEYARHRMREIRKGLDLGTVRMFTSEDEADEVAIYILIQMGIDPWQYNSALEYLDDTTEEGCDLSKVPNYGPLEDDHHNACWRVYRNGKYRQHLLNLPKKDRDTFYKKRGSLPGRN